jgi:uncharacterized membrane protein
MNQYEFLCYRKKIPKTLTWYLLNALGREHVNDARRAGKQIAAENRLKQTGAAQIEAGNGTVAQAVTEITADRHVWMLKRRSVATSIMFAFGVVAGVVLGVAILCALSGAWSVLPRAVIETLVIGGMLWLYASRERGYDCIELFDGVLIVLRTDTDHVERVELNPLWTEITLGGGLSPKIEIRYAGSTLEVGAHVPLDERRRVVDEVNRQLAAMRRRSAR